MPDLDLTVLIDVGDKAANGMPLCERCDRSSAVSYDARLCVSCLTRCVRDLSSAQIEILRRAKESMPKSLVLEPHEVPAAMGLVSRRLVSSCRDGRTSSILAQKTRYRRGATRWLRLTCLGDEALKRGLVRRPGKSEPT